LSIDGHGSFIYTNNEVEHIILMELYMIDYKQALDVMISFLKYNHKRNKGKDQLRLKEHRKYSTYMSFYFVDVYFILLDVHNGNNGNNLLTEIIEIFARS
jgi:hypothetical protein